MKILIRTLLVCVLLVSSASAQEGITGAFGLKLGDVFDTKGVQPVEGRENMYPCTPAAPVKGLTYYTVLVTPKTRRIAGIYAYGETPNAESAWDLATMLGIVLRNKYGSATGPENTKTEQIAPPAPTLPGRPRLVDRGPRLLDMPTRITQGHRAAEVAAREQHALPSSSGRKAAVYLSYWDSELTAEVQKETVLLQQEKDAAEKAEKEAREKAAQEKLEQVRAAENERRAKVREALKENASKFDASAL